MAGETIWMQCLERLVFLSEINGNPVEPVIVDRLAVLVTQELTFDVRGLIQRVTQDPDNKFDDPIPF